MLSLDQLEGNDWSLYRKRCTECDAIFFDMAFHVKACCKVCTDAREQVELAKRKVRSQAFIDLLEAPESAENALEIVDFVEAHRGSHIVYDVMRIGYPKFVTCIQDRLTKYRAGIVFLKPEHKAYLNDIFCLKMQFEHNAEIRARKLEKRAKAKHEKDKKAKATA